MTTKHRTAIILLLAIYLVFLIRNFWASDDAFITLRVVRNLFHGYGLNWNGAERVQVFTHPLWLLVLTPFYVLTRNPFLTLYAACFVFSTPAVFLLLYKISPPSWVLPIVTAALLASKSFMDYSSSGLENPLSHLLILLFIWVFLRDEGLTNTQILLLSLLVSLSLLNRLDTLLIFLPAYLLILWLSRGNLRNISGNIILGFLPIILWEIFSLLYYGFPFPNSYYAKLTTGIPQAELYRQGWFYFQNSLIWDHITLPVIALGVLFSFLQREPKRISLAVGIVLYLGYILRIGGDFMSGRFFSTPFLLSLALILSLPKIRNTNIRPGFSLAAACLILFAGLTSYKPPMLIQATERNGTIDKHGVADEKLVYFRCCSLLGQLKGNAPSKIVDDARKAEQEGVRLVIRESIGVYGFYTGPDVYIMDKVCLSDPLRARLPVTGAWRIGHFYRDYPLGYPESIEAGFVNRIREPHLHEYYDRLMLITRGELLSPERLKTIIIFNLGAYDHLIDEYMQSRDLENR
jgi:arabinofuranosyltransferase